MNNRTSHLLRRAALGAFSLFASAFVCQFSNAQNPPVPEAPPFRPIPADSNCVAPVYPASSLRNGETGLVRVGFLVDVDGTVLESQVLKSSYFKTLDNATVQAFKKCKYSPAIESGNPVKGWIQIHYRWVLS